MRRIKMKRIRPKLFQRLKAMWSILFGVLTLLFPNTEQIMSRNRSDVVLKRRLPATFFKRPLSIDNLSPIENASINSDPDGTHGVSDWSRQPDRLRQTKIRKFYKDHQIAENNTSCFDSQNSSLSVHWSNNPESYQFKKCSNKSSTHSLSKQSLEIIDSSRLMDTRERLIELSTSTAMNIQDWNKNSTLSFHSLKFDGVTSCQDRCGGNVHLPCSCAEICLINGNCCFDIEEKCPTLVKAVRSKFSHLLQAKVECSTITKTFMVMSCPSETRSDGSNINNDLVSDKANVASVDDATLTFQYKNSVTQNGGSAQRTDAAKNDFLSLILDAPITDLATQLVYRNRSVALCNGVLESDLMPWTIRIKLLNKTKPQSLEDVESFTDAKYFDYIAPDISESSVKSLCISIAIRKCENEWLTDRPELEKNCHNGGITYYKVQNHFPIYYENIYCMLCSIGSDNGSTPVLAYSIFERYFRLSLVASFSSSGILKITNNDNLGFTLWGALNCSLSTVEQEHSQCSAFECKKTTEIRIDEACEKLTQAQFAISEGSCTYPRSQAIERELLVLIKCYLETYDNAIFKSENVRFDTIYDKRLGLPLLRVSMAVYYPGLRFALQRKQIWTELAMLVRGAKFPCDPVLDRVECEDSHCRIGDLLVPEITSVEAVVEVGVTAPSDKDKPIEASTDSLTIFCESNVYFNNKEVKDLMCFYIHDTDSLQVEFSERSAKLSCLGDKVREKFLYWRTLHMRNNVCLRLPGGCLVFSLLVSFIKINLFPD